MAFYLDMAALIKQFGVPITVYPALPKDAQGEYVDAKWVPAKQPDPVQVSEVIVPLGRIGSYSQMFQLKDLGQDEHYEAEWLSLATYEMGTVIEHDGHRMVVRNKDDYSDYSNVTIYYLDADSDDQKEDEADA